MNLDIAKAAFVDELENIAQEKTAEEEKKPKELTTGESLLALFAGGPGGYFGAKKAREAGESALEGGLRGFGGSALGAIPGALVGRGLGTLVGRTELAPAVGQLLGTTAGSIGGYKALTSKYNQLPEEKTGAELAQAAREHISKKNFALSAKQSDTGKPAYPIEDRRHAANALSRVGHFGSPKEKAEVYKDVAHKYPDMARHSDVTAVRKKAAGIDPGMMHSFKHAFSTHRAVAAGLEEAIPALGAAVGAGLAGGAGKSQLGGAALGYGLGSVPVLAFDKKFRHLAGPGHAA